MDKIMKMLKFIDREKELARVFVRQLLFSGWRLITESSTCYVLRHNNGSRIVVSIKDNKLEVKKNGKILKIY